MRNAKFGVYVADITVNIKYVYVPLFVLCADSLVLLVVYWYCALVLSKESLCSNYCVLILQPPLPSFFFWRYYYLVVCYAI
jgi:hypothetical protein